MRELNAQSSAWVRSGLERRGFTFLRQAGYQCTWPIPQLMHVSETRMGGLLSRPLLWVNQEGPRPCPGYRRWSPRPFDSWVMALRRSGS
ncbi:MAG: hypothetical protein R3E96_08095 [Planctomycetota bacterium]